MVDSFVVGWSLVGALLFVAVVGHCWDRGRPRSGVTDLPPRLHVVRPPPVPKRGRVARLLESIHLGERRP